MYSHTRLQVLAYRQIGLQYASVFVWHFYGVPAYSQGLAWPPYSVFTIIGIYLGPLPRDEWQGFVLGF